MAKKTTVIVTGVTGGGVGYGILEALMMKRNAYRLIGTDVNEVSVGLLHADVGYIVPPATDSGYVSKMVSIIKEEGAHVLIPGSEPELKRLTLERKKIEEAGALLLANDHELVRVCDDKWETFKLLSSKGILTPKSALPENKDEFIKEFGFPLLIKSRTGSGSRDMSVVRDKAELEFFERDLKQRSVPYLLQEYVGSGDDEYTIGVLVDKGRDIIGSFALHRILAGLSNKQKVKHGERTYSLSTGISQGIVEDNPQILRQAEDIARKIGVTGPCNIQARFTNGKLNVFEVNPRFSGTSTFRAALGFNEPHMLIRNHLFGEKFKNVKYKTGVYCLRALKSVFVPASDIEELKRSGKVVNSKKRCA
jgi:carbamoyl-phosphate synthase large subunit